MAEPSEPGSDHEVEIAVARHLQRAFQARDRGYGIALQGGHEPRGYERMKIAVGPRPECTGDLPRLIGARASLAKAPDVGEAERKPHPRDHRRRQSHSESLAEHAGGQAVD